VNLVPTAQRFINRLSRFLQSIPAPLILAVFSLVSFGLMIPWLGLYADDWTFIWTFETLQTPGILRYFTVGGNRPVWGIFYSFFVPLLGHQPWIWHLFAIFWLWLCVVLVWQLVRLVWPGYPRTALAAALLFAVYPGLQLHYISLTFGHMWLVYATFLGSLCANLKAYRSPRHFLAWSALAVWLSAVNLLSFEYFITLELIRPVLLWITLTQPDQSKRSCVSALFKAWLPYLLLFTSVILWRVFLFPLQTIRYQFSLLSDLRSNPLETIQWLFSRIGGDVFWQSTLRAWSEALTLPFRQDWSTLAGFAALALLVTVAAVSYWILSVYPGKTSVAEKVSDKTKIGMMVTGVIALFLGGMPFWVTGLIVEPAWWNSRFTMPFILGAALLFAGLIWLLPWRSVRCAVAALLIGAAVSTHFQIANEFRVDWIHHNDLLWQLHWRMPGLKPGTTLLSNDLPLKYFSDNTLSAELNWILSEGKAAYRADTFWAYISEMIRLDQPIKNTGQTIRRDMISIDYFGSSDQIIGLYYRSGSCLRVLDPRYDPLYFNTLQEQLELETQFDPLTSRINEYLAIAARLTRENLILPQGEAFELDPALYGTEDRSYWCYYYEKADLARQQGDWQQVAALADQAFGLGDYPNDPTERLPFIEGYAHVERWEQAMELTRQSADISPVMRPVLCRLWDRIDAQTPASANKAQALQWIDGELQCASD